MRSMSWEKWWSRFSEWAALLTAAGWFAYVIVLKPLVLLLPQLPLPHAPGDFLSYIGPTLIGLLVFAFFSVVQRTERLEKAFLSMEKVVTIPDRQQAYQTA